MPTVWDWLEGRIQYPPAYEKLPIQGELRTRFCTLVIRDVDDARLGLQILDLLAKHYPALLA